MLDHSVGLAFKGLKSVGDASKTLLAIEEQKIHIMVSSRGVFEDMLSMKFQSDTLVIEEILKCSLVGKKKVGKK